MAMAANDAAISIAWIDREIEFCIMRSMNLLFAAAGEPIDLSAD
jgi:hypothetical protein